MKKLHIITQNDSATGECDYIVEICEDSDILDQKATERKSNP